MNDLEQFIREIVNAKNSTIPADVEQELVAEMLNRLINQINRDLINALPESTVDAVNYALDKNDMNQVQDLIAQSGVNQQAIMARTMLNFRQQYLG